MSCAFDSEKDGKWITIHPNGSEKGSHVKVDGEGHIVAGNPHLVKAIEGKVANRASGNASVSEKIGDDLGAFAPPSDDDFGDLFDSFTPPPTETDLPGLLDGDDPKSPQKNPEFTHDGKKYVVGIGRRMPMDLLLSLQKKAISDDFKHLIAIGSTWSGNPDAIAKVSSWLGAEHPYVKALSERKAYVEAVRSGLPQFKPAEDAEAIGQKEAEKVVTAAVKHLVGHFSAVPLPNSIKIKTLTKGTKEGKERAIRYASVAIKSLRDRFPNAQILNRLSEMTFYPAKPKGGGTSGMCWSTLGVFATDTAFVNDVGYAEWRKNNPFVLGPGQGAVPSSVRAYYPGGCEMFSTFWHEVAHYVYEQTGGCLVKKKPNPKWLGIISEARDKYGFTAKHVSSYACKDDNEYHSEVIALMANPMYIQGSMPEPIERYVYEDVLGCPPGAWKKNESTWKPKV